ncbi:hypothetical protein K432DRAFT_378560 [Lepidopterella palustris CBS 459.81]|uniref:Ankyrin n=1 Tax=Lepidopterella palustris CBS 459.81 TaxID=1314670 RepID=A0A8E2EIG8_9PEZI|nr:hypothetical protein K432DRAFT_378560 [Lepidopterella palustris CBS 459.81]
MLHLLRERGTFLNTPESGGQAFRKAVTEGLESMVTLLLREGVEVDCGSVDAAVEHGHTGIARRLRDHKGEVSMKLTQHIA